MSTPFTIFVGLHPTHTSLGLHGPCRGPQSARHLHRTLRATHYIRGIREVWLDCQHLTQLDKAARQLLTEAQRELSSLGITLYVRGLAAPLRARLAHGYPANALLLISNRSHVSQ